MYTVLFLLLTDVKFFSLIIFQSDLTENSSFALFTQI